MKKALFLLLILPVFCCCKRAVAKRHSIAGGPMNTISVIIDDQLWNGEVGDSIRNKFAAPVIGLPQEEPLFTINQYPIRLLEGFMANSRNIIVVKRDKDSLYECVRDEFAKPQNVFHLTGRTASGIIAMLKRHAPEMITAMRATEIAEAQKSADSFHIDPKPILTRFGITIGIPRGFTYVVKSSRFVWLKKEITSGNCSLLIYEVPYKSIKADYASADVIRLRDSIGRLYIHGAGQRSAMLTDDSYSPYVFGASILGTHAIETRGNWELQDDFMSGPFLNYAIADPKHGRYLILEGFCYAPSEKKRDLMTGLEAIIKSTRLTVNKTRKNNGASKI